MRKTRLEQMAEADARGGTSVRGFEPITDEMLDSARKCAFMRGFKAAREEAQDLVFALDGHGISMHDLFNAIGEIGEEDAPS
jgi:hypothetical protein